MKSNVENHWRILTEIDQDYFKLKITLNMLKLIKIYKYFKHQNKYHLTNWYHKNKQICLDLPMVLLNKLDYMTNIL